MATKSVNVDLIIKDDYDPESGHTEVVMDVGLLIAGHKVQAKGLDSHGGAAVYLDDTPIIENVTAGEGWRAFRNIIAALGGGEEHGSES